MIYHILSGVKNTNKVITHKLVFKTSLINLFKLCKSLKSTCVQNQSFVNVLVLVTYKYNGIYLLNIHILQLQISCFIIFFEDIKYHFLNDLWKKLCYINKILYIFICVCLLAMFMVMYLNN